MNIRGLGLIALLPAMSLSVACAPALSAAEAPWTFEQILVPPTAAEIARADAAWGEKEQRISDVAKASETRLSVANAAYDVHLVEYRLNGSGRCGAVLIPEGPVSMTVVDLSDVRWDYPPRDISRGAYISTILGERAPEAAIVLPCFRGMTLAVNGESVTAEGDRSDAWEGATEDAMAFLTVALDAFPQLPRGENVAAYGYSRGGGVALLLGQRDPRIKRVAAFAAPTDFFSAMGRPGGGWAQSLRAAQADPDFAKDTRESQFLDWFVNGREEAGAAEIRHKMLMSSPAWFLSRLPLAQVHHGGDDGPVPVANARLVADWAERHPGSPVHVFIYEGEGHMIGGDEAFPRARKFLIDG